MVKQYFFSVIALLLSLILLVSAGLSLAEAPAVIRLGGLKGPTTMGLVHLLDSAEKGTTENKYEFTMAAAADELTPGLLKGELDILAVPANLGSVLYNKSGGSVQALAASITVCFSSSLMVVASVCSM